MTMPSTALTRRGWKRHLLLFICLLFSLILYNRTANSPLPLSFWKRGQPTEETITVGKVGQNGFPAKTDVELKSSSSSECTEPQNLYGKRKVNISKRSRDLINVEKQAVSPCNDVLENAEHKHRRFIKILRIFQDSNDIIGEILSRNTSE